MSIHYITEPIGYSLGIVCTKPTLDYGSSEFDSDFGKNDASCKTNYYVSCIHIHTLTNHYRHSYGYILAMASCKTNIFTHWPNTIDIAS